LHSNLRKEKDIHSV